MIDVLLGILIGISIPAVSFIIAYLVVEIGEFLYQKFK